MTATRILLVLSLAVACGSPSTRTRGTATADDRSRAPALFASVPSTTPYFIGAFDPISREYFAKLGEIMQPAFAQTYEEARAEGDTELLQLIDAVRVELAGKWTRAGLESLGFSTAPRFAMYDVDGIVVVRLEIADERAVLAAARRVAQRAQLQFSDGEVREGRRFWRVAEDGRTYLIALADRQLVFAYGKPETVERRLPLVLGIEKPKSNMAGGRVLSALAQRHDLGTQIIGYLDIKRVVDLAVANERSQIAGTCAQELYGIAAQFPRVVFGFRDLTVAKTTFALVVELAPDIAAALAELRAPVPGMQDMLDGKPVFALAAAADSLGVVGLAARVLARVERLARQCPHDEELGETGRLAAEWIPKLDPQSPSMPRLVLSLAGAAVRVDKVKMGAGPLPEELEAVALVATTQPKDLFETMQQQVPWLASLRSTPDGQLQPLHGFGDFHVGVGRHVIAAAAGQRGKQVAARVLAAESVGPAPLFAFNWDHGQLLALKGERASTQEDPEKAAEWELDGMLAKYFGRATGAIDVTSAGLVMWMSYEMK